jgi:4-amino-4-deoxy-L-arabinose transferase-like glycosyltransferase
MMLAAVAATFAVLLCLDDPREVYALPLLLPLSLLAGAGLPSLRRGAANALTWFGVMSVGLLGATVWFGWFAMVTGIPNAAARQFTRLEPGFAAQVSWTAFAVALVCTIAWIGLILKSERSVAFRSATFWAAGITLLWTLAMTLLLSWIDYGKSYRPVAVALKKNIPANARCVESRGLDEAQRAILDYRVEVITRRAERHGDTGCPVLLVQAHQGDPDNLGPGWRFLWEGRRPRDHERYRLYRRVGPS